LRVQDGDTFALHRLQHFTSPAKKPSLSLVVDICATSLSDAPTTYTKSAFESVAFAAAAAPALDVSLTPPPTKAYAFLEQKDPDQVRREAHELFHSKLELIEELALIKKLEQPATEKAKEADAFTCKYKGCTREYTDGSGSGSGTKYNCGYCSRKCREAAKKAPRPVARNCQHGRQKHKCKDCGTYYCQHGRRKDMCKDCGTGHCEHGRQKHKCKDCGTGYCQHGRPKDKYKDCGTGRCEHGRQRGR
jgi:hypothetical protein